MNENDDKVTFDQYFFIDNHNQIQLLFPLTDKLIEQQITVELIMKESQIEEKNYKEFKQIHIESNSLSKKYQNTVIY